MRLSVFATLTALALTACTTPATQVTGAPMPTTAQQTALSQWIAAFRARALASGISASTFDTAMKGRRYRADVIKRDRNQSEFTKTLWDYLGTAVSDSRIRNGKTALSRHARTLAAVEQRYDVDRHVVAAIWGLESAYGAVRGNIPTLDALTTLAMDTRRSRFFETQLVAALRILQDGNTTPAQMTGSWAGAMGHTQFIPTSYLAHAVDFTGDGKRDIWSDDPTDALASTAAYLRANGWTPGQPWGVEATLPTGFDYSLANRKITKTPAQWARLGVQILRDPETSAPASLLLPAGAKGAAFLIFDNFAVIERYNTADAYVIAVGHLSDRLQNRPAIQSSWPRGDRALTLPERLELQKRLTEAGHSTQGVDGKIGPNTINAIRSYQRATGQTPDGYASLRLLEHLR